MKEINNINQEEKAKVVSSKTYNEGRGATCYTFFAVILFIVLFITSFVLVPRQRHGMIDTNGSVTSTITSTTTWVVSTDIYPKNISLPVTSVTTTPVTSATTTVIETTVETTPEVVVEPQQEEPVEIVEQVEPDPAPVVEEQPQEPVSVDPPEEGSMTYLGNLYITGYVATGNQVASGGYPYVGGVSMSTSYGLPWGTQVYIEGLGTFTLNDCGCAYGRVDVFRDTVEDCYAITGDRDVYIIN